MNTEAIAFIEAALGHLADSDYVLRRDAKRGGYRDPRIESIARAGAILEAILRDEAVAAAEPEGGTP